MSGKGGGPSQGQTDKKLQERTNLYVEMTKHMNNGDDEKIGKVASKILHLFPDDATAFKTKLVAFTNRDMFAEALALIEDTGNKNLTSPLTFEKAYILYRLQRIGEALTVLQRLNENSIRKLELMYQIYYRLDMYEDAFDLLSDVLKASEDDLDEERRINLAAIIASLKLAKSAKKVPNVEGDSYEMVYNRAVGLIGEGNIPEAEKLLVKAEELAKAREEDIGEDDLKDELALIKAQRAFCLQKTGRVKEALPIYTQILKDKPGDVGLVAVVSNNILCLNKDTISIFDAKKRIKAMTVAEVLPKLNNMQKRDMMMNECLFNLHIHQVEDTLRLCNVMKEAYPDLGVEVLLIRCSLKTFTDSLEAAKKEFVDPLQKDSTLWLRVNLALIQIALEKNNTDSAVELMQQLGENYYRSGIISAVVALYHGQGQLEKAAGILRDAVNYYKKKGSNKETMKLLWRQHASYMMQLGDFASAVESLEELRKTPGGEDSLTLAQLIIAYSRVDVEKAKKLSKLLPPSSGDLSGIDGTTLESPNWITQVKMRKSNKAGGEVVPSPGPSATASIDGIKRKSKKKRKTKPPKNFSEERTPDPERWLPKFERSGYRPKKVRKGGRADVGKGTQGADTTSAAIYDMSGKVRQANAEDTPSTPATSSAAWKKDQQKKKKNKKK